MCIILLKKIDGKIILAKNRDRNYKPKIEIVNEIINGVEIAYIRDLNTEWCEGLNQYGCSIINSALEVEYDENPFPIDNNIYLNSKFKYLTALSKSKEELIDFIFNKNFYDDISLQGHNIIASPKFNLHLESKSKIKPVAKIIETNNLVCTNHGINLKNTGYLYGNSLLSSILRKKLIEYELLNNKLDNYTDILKLMNKNYKDIDQILHPYRDTKLNVFTTGQLLLNLTDKILLYKYDTNSSYFQGIINKLPKNYKSQIKIIVEPTIKDKLNYEIPIPKNKLDQIFNTYIKK